MKSDAKIRGTWKVGVVEEMIAGRDGVVRAVKLRTANNHLERPIQHLYPLELSCDQKAKEPAVASLNAEAPEFTPRTRRGAAIAAGDRITAITLTEDEVQE